MVVVGRGGGGGRGLNAFYGTKASSALKMLPMSLRPVANVRFNLSHDITVT